jgi:hypothetical protein
MEKKNILESIKQLFSVETSEFETVPSIMDNAEAIDMAYVDVKTVDGMTLRVADLAVGVACYHIAEDGTETLCEAGAEYELEDGTKIVIGEEGLIAEIMQPEEAEVEVEVDMKDKDKKEMYSEETEETVEEAVEEVTEEAFAKVSEIETLRQANIMLAEKLDELTARVEAFAKAPSAEAVVTTTAFNKSKQVLETREERLKFFGSK